MTAPVRIQRSRAKGWKMPPNTVYVGRGSKWGNPFVVGRDGTREECVRLYRFLLGGLICVTSTPEIAEQRAVLRYATKNISDLKGKSLACWCRVDGKPCHADVLLELANAPSTGTRTTP